MTWGTAGGPPQGAGTVPRGAPAAPVPGGGGPPRRYGPWIGLVVALLVCVLVGGVAIGVGSVWILDPFDRRAEGAAAGEASSPSPTLATGGTEDYSFSYPASWELQDSTEDPTEWEIYSMEVRSSDGVELMRVFESEVLGEPIASCWDVVEDEGYTQQDEVEIDGRLVKHFQNRTPSDSGRPRVRDVWCAATEARTMVMIVGSTTREDADALPTSSVQGVIDTWVWTD